MDPGWLIAGVLLYVLHQVVRTRGWFNIIRAAYPEASELRARDVTFAYLAGAGLNGVMPARGGDLAYATPRLLLSIGHPRPLSAFLTPGLEAAAQKTGHTGPVGVLARRRIGTFAPLCDLLRRVASPKLLLALPLAPAVQPAFALW